MFIHIAEGNKNPRFILSASENERWDEPQEELNIRAETRELAYQAALGYATVNVEYKLCSTCCHP